MLHKLWYAFGMIYNRRRVPPLPRGMLATDYEDIPGPERRVMARLGARDPRGVQFAMKRAGVQSVEELVELLDHYKPQRNIWQRIYNGLGRLVGGEDHDPHREEIVKDIRRNKKTTGRVQIEERVKIVSRAFKEKN